MPALALVYADFLSNHACGDGCLLRHAAFEHEKRCAQLTSIQHEQATPERAPHIIADLEAWWVVRVKLEGKRNGGLGHS